MDAFPAVFPLKGLTVVVAGAGEAAEAKARLFDGSPAALLRVVGPDTERRESYLGARLAFIAQSSPERAAATARDAGALVNVIDRPDLCDFTTPAIVDRGAVVGAIATGGAAPVLAAELRRELEALWPAGLGAVALLLADLREEVRAARPAPADRRAWLRTLLEGEAAAIALAGDREGAAAAARAQLDQPATAGRRLLLTPPASPDLLSLRALRALSRADRLVVAGDVPPELLKLARRDAPITPLEQVDLRAASGPGLVVYIGPEAAFAGLGALERLPVARA